jgi:hypothetical protein
MTPQEVFDKAYKSVIEQGEPAYTESNGCRYRTANTEGKELKCALGFFIDDEIAWIADEHAWLTSEVIKKANLEEHDKLLLSIQIAHDSSAVEEDFLESFKNRMSNVAKHYKLEVSALV